MVGGQAYVRTYRPPAYLLLTRPKNNVRPELVEGGERWGFDKLSPNGTIRVFMGRAQPKRSRKPWLRIKKTRSSPFANIHIGQKEAVKELDKSCFDMTL